MYTNEINSYKRTLLISTNLPKNSTIDFDPDHLEFTDILGEKQSNISNMPISNETEADDNIIINTTNLENVKTDTITTSETQYDAYFKKASETYNIPVYLLKAVAKQESNFQANCVSKSGAVGIMQLMPATASSLGVHNSYDPEQNIMGGAKYLANNLKTFNNDASLALAAYNAGPNAVKKYNGIPPYTETQNYVPKVLKYANMYKNLDDTSGKIIGGSRSSAQTSNYNELLHALNTLQINSNNSYNQLAQLLNPSLNDTGTNTILNQALEELMSSKSASNWLSKLNI